MFYKSGAELDVYVYSLRKQRSMMICAPTVSTQWCVVVIVVEAAVEALLQEFSFRKTVVSNKKFRCLERMEKTAVLVVILEEEKRISFIGWAATGHYNLM